MPAPIPDPTDVCSFGHQLAPGSEEMVLKEYGPDGQKLSETVVLLRNHYHVGAGGLFDSGSTPSVTRPDKVVGYPCAHGLPEAEVDPEDLPLPPFRGNSYGRGHWLTYGAVRYVGKVPIPMAQCPVCLGGEAPDWRS
jgi:hypothetical protein